MNKLKYSLFSSLWIISCVIAVQAQPVETFESKLAQFLETSPQRSQEKVFVHTDRSTYFAGETVWFKLHCVDAQFRLPSPWSKVAYIDLIDRSGNLIQQSKIDLTAGVAERTLEIPATAKTDYYYLIAYTQWMKNGDPIRFWRQPIAIINPEAGIPLKEPGDSIRKVAQIRFSPEGGSLVDQLNSHIVFQATDTKGVPFAVSGQVVDQSGTVITEAQSGTEGIGQFELRPDIQQTYSFEIKDEDRRFALPKIQPSGIAVRIDALSDTEVTAKALLHKHLTNNLHLIAHANGQVQAVASSPSDGDSASFSIPIDQLAAGVNHFSFFDNKGQLLAERPVYIPAPEQLNIQVQTQTQTLGKRTEVVVDFLTTSQTGKAVSARLSMSARRENPLSGHASQLQIARPATGSPQSKQIDMQMILQRGDGMGWVESERLLSPRYLPELYGHLLKGRVVDAESGEGIPQAMVYLSLPGKIPQLDAVLTNNDGSFSFLTEHRYGTHEIAVRSQADSSRTSRVQLVRSLPLDISRFPLPSLELSKVEQEQLAPHHLYHQVGKAYDLFLPKTDEPQAVEPLPFYHKADRIYPLDEFTRFTTEETFVEIVYSVALRNKRGEFFLRVFDKYTQTIFRDDPLMMIDGIPIASANEIMAINAKQLAQIEVITGKYYKGDAEFLGIVHAVTYKGDGQTVAKKPELLRKPYSFFATPKTFSGPDYSDSEVRAMRVPDFRNLLHWAPDIQTDENGKAQIRFYTSDAPGNFEIEVNGIGPSGSFGEETARIEVSDEF